MQQIVTVCKNLKSDMSAHRKIEMYCGLHLDLLLAVCVKNMDLTVVQVVFGLHVCTHLCVCALDGYVC